MIRNLCDEYGAVFIADSVQCGYGRTGKFYSHDFAGVEADIYSMAKGMGNGFPIGGISISPKIAPKHFMLGTTFGGNHLGVCRGTSGFGSNGKRKPDEKCRRSWKLSDDGN